MYNYMHETVLWLIYLLRYFKRFDVYIKWVVYASVIVGFGFQSNLQVRKIGTCKKRRSLQDMKCIFVILPGAEVHFLSVPPNGVASADSALWLSRSHNLNHVCSHPDKEVGSRSIEAYHEIIQ
jgi:hypothetical protein